MRRERYRLANAVPCRFCGQWCRAKCVTAVVDARRPSEVASLVPHTAPHQTRMVDGAQVAARMPHALALTARLLKMRALLGAWLDASELAMSARFTAAYAFDRGADVGGTPC